MEDVDFHKYLKDMMSVCGRLLTVSGTQVSGWNGMNFPSVVMKSPVPEPPTLCDFIVNLLFILREC